MRTPPPMTVLSFLAVALLGAAPAKKASATKPPVAAAQAPSAPAAPAPVPPTPQPRKEARIIALDEGQARVFHTVYTHPSIPVILQFPEKFLGQPSCGDCVDLTAPPEVLQSTDALFGVQVYAAEQYIFVKPAQYARRDGGRIPEDNFLTTLTVRLESKLTLTLRIQYGTVDQADARVIFTLPGREAETQFVQEQLKTLRQQLEADYADRVAAAVKKDMARLFLEPHSCNLTPRKERNDDIIVEVKEVCRFGQRGFIRFTIENRHKALFNIADVQVQAGRGKDAVAVESLVHLFQGEATEVPFRATLAGVAAFDVPENDAAGRFELSVLESGGRNRQVLVSELGL